MERGGYIGLALNGQDGYLRLVTMMTLGRKYLDNGAQSEIHD